MKKLMIAAAIVCAAVMAEAGAVNWSLSNIKNATGTAITTGYVYTFSSKESTYTTQSALQEALGKATTAEAFLAVLTGAKYESALSGAITESGTFKTGDVDVGTFKTFTPGTSSVKLFSLIVDSADGSINANTKWVVTAAPSTPKGIPTEDSKTVATFTLNANTSTAAANWKSIPEPTSGLLMLLGVAGLALRRRRA